MDLDELRSVQSRERQTDSLQQLRESFYQDAGEFIQQLHRERERAADEADDPWDAPEVTRLSDDIDTAEQTVEAIYERRVGKIVKMASLAAADMPTEDEGLTTEERTLFDTLVDAIERNRANVEAVIDGEDPLENVADAGAGPEPRAGGTGNPASDPTDDATPAADDGAAAPSGGPPEPTPDPDDAGVPSDPASADGDSRPVPPEGPNEAPADASSGESGVDAADLMAGDGPDGESAEPDPQSGTDASEDGPTAEPPAPDERGGDDRASPESEPSDADRPAADATAPADGAVPAGDETEEATDAPAVERATVRITADVGEIFGVDQRAYDLSTDDVVQLPEANADPLVERDAAERLD
ncbi:hypothetical protein [Halosimplex sp. J119]